ncbi:hypothetical protein L6164_029172 [Bauhinia variegata]|uniref:Uncharacterized protein n=1 Tax=Bauhinia variegata TaxID=167791 RepID=A0ACB9L7V3_BAUVA|nr:hypothetical protein L6164_029172 [Bauhinia variegata]
MGKEEFAEWETNGADSQAVVNQECGTLTVQNEDVREPLEEVRTQYIDCGPDLDGGQDGISDGVIEITYVESNTLVGNEDNVVEESELDRRIDECKDFHSEARQENKPNTLVGNEDNVVGESELDRRIDEIEDLHSEARQENQSNTLEGNEDNVVGESELDRRIDESKDLYSEARREKKSNTLEVNEDNVVGESELDRRIDESKDFHSEARQENRSNTLEGNEDNVVGESELDKRIDESKDLYSEARLENKSNTLEVNEDNVVGESELDGRIDESKDLHSEARQENTETSNVKVDSCQKVHEGAVMNNQNPDKYVNIVEDEYSSDKVGGNRDFQSRSQEGNLDNYAARDDLAKEMDENGNLVSTKENQKTDKISGESNKMEPTYRHSLDSDQETQGVAEKSVTFSSFVSTLMRRFSGRSDKVVVGNSNEVKDSTSKEIPQRTVDVEGVFWNPLNYIKMSPDVDIENKTEQSEVISEGPPEPVAMKGRIILYTRLGCQECKVARQFLYMKRLRYVEVNIDVYPSRKWELEKISGSTYVPTIFFNEIHIGGLSELTALNRSGRLDEKIDFVMNEAPSFEAPLPPLSGEDDVSGSGAQDEMALIVRKMKESIVVKDRFHKFRRFTKCFVASEAVDFLSEDQYLERQDAVEFARKLAKNLFFQHILEENLFEDGNYLYSFLDDDPIVASQCHNIPRGITTMKPKPIGEIASRLRLLSYGMFEAYASENGCHVDYRSMHGSEEFARYLRIVEELQRVQILNMSREEKLAFYINLYNMMAIHAILLWGHPAGALERRKMFTEFKYVIGGCTFSLSDILNGILRGNQRPPYTLMKPFGAKDKRLRMALRYHEPLIHFALVCGTRSGPSLRCYSPGEIDQELMNTARNFLRSGGLLIDANAKIVYASKILKWFSVDFGKNEVEILKHVSNYLDPADTTVLLDLLATSELKVVYEPYDWGWNN